MRLKSYLLLFGVFALPPMFPPGALAGDAPVIVILGDSISAAYNMETGQSWPSLLQERLHRNGYTHRVFNSTDTEVHLTARAAQVLDHLATGLSAAHSRRAKFRCRGISGHFQQRSRYPIFDVGYRGCSGRCLSGAVRTAHSQKAT